MNFMRWFTSLDEFFYEVVSWVVFFPLTLGKIIRHPLVMTDYAASQLALPREEQWRAALSPPVLLVLALLISQAIELGTIGPNPIVESRHGFSGLVNDDASLLLLRIILFGSFPVIFAIRMVKLMGLPLDRDTLKAPFYAQCYIVTPFALMLGIGAVVAQLGNPLLHYLGFGILALAGLVYVHVQALWFSRQLHQSLGRGYLNAITGSIQSVVLILVLAVITYL